MRWLRSVIIILAVMQAGWMSFDGARALIVGDYVTPTTGEHAGQLGAWSKIVLAVGVDPRSPVMKGIFVFYGITWLLVISFFAQEFRWTRPAMLVAAVGTLWYLPLGTVSSLIQIALLILERRMAPK